MSAEVSLEKVIRRLVSLCPREEVSFNPPLTPTHRIMLLSCLGDTMPTALLELLSIHDGAKGSIRLIRGGRMELFSSQEIISYFFAGPTISGFSSAEHCEGPVRCEVSFERRVPFAYLNDLPVCVDYDPPKEGRLGQVVLVDQEQLAQWVLNSSITEFFEDAISRMQAKTGSG